MTDQDGREVDARGEWPQPPTEIPTAPIVEDADIRTIVAHPFLRLGTAFNWPDNELQVARELLDITVIRLSEKFQVIAGQALSLQLERQELHTTLDRMRAELRARIEVLETALETIIQSFGPDIGTEHSVHTKGVISIANAALADPQAQGREK